MSWHSGAGQCIEAATLANSGVDATSGLRTYGWSGSQHAIAACSVLSYVSGERDCAPCARGRAFGRVPKAAVECVDEAMLGTMCIPQWRSLDVTPWI